VLLIVIPVRTAMRSFAVAPPHLRIPLAGFVVSTIAYATATFFVDLYVPWIYFWAYTGVTMRLAMIARETVPEPVTVNQPVLASQRGDGFGWIGAVRH